MKQKLIKNNNQNIPFIPQILTRCNNEPFSFLCTGCGKIIQEANKACSQTDLSF